MKVLVLNPPAFGTRFTREGRCQSESDTWLENFPPSTLASVAGTVREKHDVKLIDCIGANISFDEMIKQAREFNPDFTVIDTSTPTIETDIKTAEEIKKIGSKTILYGEHITARYKELVKNKALDYLIIGEPDTPIMNILEGKPKSKGVAFENFDGGIWQETDLDKLPFPAYDLLPPYKYPLTLERWTFVRSGRGCPFNCVYCIVPLVTGRKVRYHSSEYMIKQLQWLDSIGIHVWMFWDELATLNKQRMIEICDGIKRLGLNKRNKWFCTTRVDVFDEELAKNMSSAGCKMIAFGLESGNQQVLDNVRKQTNLKQAERAVGFAKKYKMRTIGHFILGLPGSSEKTEQQSINFAKKLKLDFVQFYIATPFPGSEFYKKVQENNWFKDKNWEKVEQGSVAISYPNFPSERIHYMRRKAYLSFYLRPSAIYRGLTAMSPKAILKMPFSYIPTFFRWMLK